jgi:hypothetical protein
MKPKKDIINKNIAQSIGAAKARRAALTNQVIIKEFE